MKGDTTRYEEELKTKSAGQAQRMTDINFDSLSGRITIMGSAMDGLKSRSVIYLALLFVKVSNCSQKQFQD